MKVVCVDNVKTGSVLPLTIGKVYETSGGPAAQYTIISDNGMTYELSISRFVTIDEWREIQLKELGI